MQTSAQPDPGLADELTWRRVRMTLAARQLTDLLADLDRWAADQRHDSAGRFHARTAARAVRRALRDLGEESP